MRWNLVAAFVLGSLTLATVALADRGDQTGAGTTTAKAATPQADEKPSRWRGSVMLFDQSATTQTLGAGTGYQSSNQAYELWVALKPRYVAYESESKKTTLSLNLWTNLYLELTNSDSTTTEHEPLLGPTHLSASFSQVIFERSGYKTSFNLGPRLSLPTDKESRNAGRYLGLGIGGGLSQSFPINGKEAPLFGSFRLGVSSLYSHPWNRATTPTNPNIQQARQDLGGRQVFDDQLRGGFNVKDSLGVTFSGGVQITPKLEFGALYVITNSWKYRGAPAQDINLPTGLATPGSVENATNHSVTTWALLSADYDALDEMAIGIGYYNQVNQIGPDGQRRSPFWSPEARIFLTATANLDVIFRHFEPTPPPAQTASVK